MIGRWELNSRTRRADETVGAIGKIDEVTNISVLDSRAEDYESMSLGKLMESLNVQERLIL
jgi:hypothetical protein